VGDTSAVRDRGCDGHEGLIDCAVAAMSGKGMQEITVSVSIPVDQRPSAGIQAARSVDAIRIVLVSLASGRPAPSLIAGLLTFLVVSRGARPGFGLALTAGFAVSLATMFGFVLDDISDLPADQIVGKHTALADGRISILQAKQVCGFLALSAISFSPGGVIGRGMILATLAALGTYHSFSRAIPVLKGAYTATLTCVPLFYGGLIAHVRVPASSYVTLWIFMAGRELFIDAHQADADRRTGFATLAVRCNRRTVETCGRYGMLLAVTLLILMAGNLGAQVMAALSAGGVVWVLYAPISPLPRPALLLLPVAIGVCAIALSI
jgi:4-hydroxybenzoate polyprenyltransferase